MQLRYLTNLSPAGDGMQKITSACWSPNSQRLAIVATDKIVQLFDESGERQDRFSTKPADKNQRTYVVRAMAFSPDSTKLAIAQSDNIVFVYKLGSDWKDKKSICNKFQQTASVTCLTWPQAHPNEVVFGLTEGRVKVGQLRTNKAATLFQTDSFVVSLCSSPDGHSILSGHLDGSIYRFSFETDTSGASHQKVASFGTPVTALEWGAGIVAAGNTGVVRFYDSTDGREVRNFDYSNDTSVKEFTCAAFNPSGESVVLGNYNRIMVYAYKQRTAPQRRGGPLARGQPHVIQEWEEVVSKIIPNLYTVTALCWKPDGSRLVVGSLCGSVDVFDACIRRARYKGIFDFTYIAASQVIVRNSKTGGSAMVRSSAGYEIKKLNVFQNRYLVANTVASLLLGDLETGKTSEIVWPESGGEKFYFDNPNVCMVFRAGELSLVEYGSNEALGSARTEHMSPHLISVRIDKYGASKMKGSGGGPLKLIAYLLDLQTIRISDLSNGQTLATVNHDCRIDWLELNPAGDRLLFRDHRRQLHLYTLEKQSRTTLLNYCNYVQWVPDSDVVVAQNRQNLCVWYSIEEPDRVTMTEIKGDIEDIERTKGRTVVLVDDGAGKQEYELNEALISFGGCIERRLFGQAVVLLSELALTAETEALWRQLAEAALDDDAPKLSVAQSCYAVLGDVAKATYLQKVNAIVKSHAAEFGGDGTRYYLVQAKLAMLSKQFQRAEALLLDHNDLEGAMTMYQELHRYDESIRLAEKKNHPDVQQLKLHFLQWLMSTGQEEKAGELQEREGNYFKAIELYVKGGLPAKAAMVVNRHSASYSPELLQRIASALTASGMHDKAGEVFEKLGMINPAMDSYRKGHAFRKAVELAKASFPGLVVTLEEEWGDWLVTQKQVDAAIQHFIEAGCSQKAIEAAMAARQWNKAEQLLESLRDPTVAQPFYIKIAQHYAAAKQYENAERFYIKADRPYDAVAMYVETNHFDRANRVAKMHLSAADMKELYSSMARKLEGQNKLNEAELAYVSVQEYDLAINMYKKREDFEQMLRLVAKYRREHLLDSYKLVAEHMERKGNLKAAEHYYIEARAWQNAVQMYRQLDRWEDAQRVAKLQGGQGAFQKVVLAQAHEVSKTHGPDAGAQVLIKHGLVEVAIDYALQHNNFDHAIELAQTSARHKLPDIYLKKALMYEDQEEFRLAEEQFIMAGKPKEAVDMYMHQHDWVSAMRVADAHDRSLVTEVMMGHAKDLSDQNQFQAAENLFISAQKPEMAISMYTGRNMINEAIRVCKKHCPHLLWEVMATYGPQSRPGGGAQRGGSVEETLETAKAYEEAGQWGYAIDAYLSITSSVLPNPDKLEEIWEAAIRLAMTNVRDRYPSVVRDVAARLQAIDRLESAGDLYESMNQYREAVQCYVAVESWDRAKAAASAAGTSDLLVWVEEEHKRALVKRQDGESLLKQGELTTALDLYARSGEWDKCLALAEQSAPQLLPHYVLQNAKVLVKQGEMVQAAQQLVRHTRSLISLVNAPPTSQQAPAQNIFPLVKLITEQLLSAQEALPSTQILKELLVRVLGGASGSSSLSLAQVQALQSPAASEFQKHLMLAHLMTTYALCKQRANNGLREVCAKQAVAMLRYCTELPADKAFYDAGVECKNVGWISMAFTLFNRYLDIAEAIEDPDNSTIDNTDFEDSDIPTPYDLNLPERQSQSASTKDEVKDLVLSWSVDANIESGLQKRQCNSCQGDMYFASLRGPCGAQYEMCCVTGFPVSPADRVQCSTCQSPANRSDWNAYVLTFHQCPWCSAPQNPAY
ncbi:unnamed protein product [Vitrella brassicaformis CCMP3155]|uniref:Uncharacterized protein n=2 Tax=Vitrella brassicaformis TaxID=1169539 RepID=A0A0G4F7G8_VITBC|nr:unnamed protein product [Vitrella brassicaformis CCMP3155]|mmetsp:Transcript_7031/g.17077  ORF Transcript_7031/g.17077 Transcript_7031/m.17077 type:complete len:1793 (+) Transcript_7031:68-5446(+)|eukprot:CEM08051.1 unnamed protein product [Vitrella brassicaformis CCMP3155]